MSFISRTRIREETRVAGVREYPLRVRTKQMLAFAALVAGAPWALSTRFGQLADFDFLGWMALGGFGLMTVVIVIGSLQRILHRRLILTPTELVVPSSWRSRRMTAIPRSSITKCRIAVRRRRRARCLVVDHSRGVCYIYEDLLPSNAALDEIFDTLANDLNPRWRANVVATQAILDVKYTDYINWPVPIAVAIIAAIVALAPFAPSGHVPEQFWLLMAPAITQSVVAWWVIGNLRLKNARIVVTPSTLSAPAFSGSKRRVSIPLSLIRQLDITNEERKRTLVVGYAGGGFAILERSLRSPKAFDQLYATLSKAVAGAQETLPNDVHVAT